MLSAWVQAWDHAQTQGPVLELNGQFLIQGMGKVGQGWEEVKRSGNWVPSPRRERHKGAKWSLRAFLEIFFFFFLGQSCDHRNGSTFKRTDSLPPALAEPCHHHALPPPLPPSFPSLHVPRYCAELCIWSNSLNPENSPVLQMKNPVYQGCNQHAKDTLLLTKPYQTHPRPLPAPSFAKPSACRPLSWREGRELWTRRACLCLSASADLSELEPQ